MSGPAPVAPSPSPPPVAEGAAGRRRRGLAAVLTALGTTGLLLWTLSVGDAGTTASPSGLPTAGRLVEWGHPVASLAGRLAAVGALGSLLFAAVLLPGRGQDLPVESRRALRAASAWASAWASATVIGALLALSRLTGTAPTALPWSSVRVFVEETGAGRAAVLVVALTAVLALTASVATRTGARVLLAAALAALVLPVVLSGHSSAAENHVLAVTTLGIHVVAAAVWVGGLVGLLLHGRGGAAAGVAAPRFSRLALGCFLATAVSGVAGAVFVLGGTGAAVAALGTGYGALLLAKTAALVLLGVLGRQHRRVTLPRLRAGDGTGFRRLAAGELLLMLATVTVAVALAASPPPVAAPASGTPVAAADPQSPADPMAGHDHGELSVGVLVDEGRFHVAGPVAAGSRVSVLNSGEQTVTLTADDGSFDVVAPPGSLTAFAAPRRPGEYRFSSTHAASFADVLVVRR